MFACGTEKGKLIVANYSEDQQFKEISQRDSERLDVIRQAYYLNFPQRNPERNNPSLLIPAIEFQAHQNSIFDLVWLSDSKIATASGDQSGILFDTESQLAISKLTGKHEAPIKCVAKVS